MPVHRNLMKLLIMAQPSNWTQPDASPWYSHTCAMGVQIVKRPTSCSNYRQTGGTDDGNRWCDRYITMDLHAGQIQGFFDIPGDVLSAYHILKPYLLGKVPNLTNPVLLTADLGFAKQGRRYAQASISRWHLLKNAGLTTRIMPRL
jgi:ribose-phosphate pyrophosphokinase